MTAPSNRKPGLAKRLAKKLFLVLFGLGIAFVLVEGLCRVLAYRSEQQKIEGWAKFLAHEARSVHQGKDVTLGEMIRPSASADVIYQFIPDLDVRFMNVPAQTNSHGFRGRETTFEKPAATYRILGLGDSVMFGWGVEQDQTFLAVSTLR